MKILVTGAMGFIGSNLTEKLVADGHEVTALDNLHTGNENNLNSVKDKVKMVKEPAGFVEKMEEKFDAVLHQGVYSSSPMYKENPHLTSTVMDEMISILEYCRKNDSKLVYASSSSVYNGHAPPHHEGMEIKVADYYTEGRYAMERVGELYHKLYGIPIIALRYFSVYGPHEEYKKQFANLITQFLWEARKGKNPVVFGDGNQTRDFTYVTDIVEANLLGMNSDVKYGVYNAGTGRAVTINEMIKILGEKLGKEIQTEYIENKIKNYVQHTGADPSKAEKELGFKAKVSLEDGIKMQVEHYKEAPKV